nr:hypothetical protein GCM10020093_086070 [Planobispora longispora]
MSVPSGVLPLKNSTLATVPSASAASAVISTVAGAVKDAPATGLVILTLGAWLPGSPPQVCPLIVKAAAWGCSRTSCR